MKNKDKTRLWFMFLEQSLVSRPVPVAARRHMGSEDEVSLAVSTGRQKQSASPHRLRGCCRPELSSVRKLRVLQPKIPDSQPNVCGPHVNNPPRSSARKKEKKLSCCLFWSRFYSSRFVLIQLDTRGIWGLTVTHRKSVWRKLWSLYYKSRQRGGDV